eukprot:6198023-Pleurochrysis_carterae.AAC.4
MSNVCTHQEVLVAAVGYYESPWRHGNANEFPFVVQVLRRPKQSSATRMAQAHGADIPIGRRVRVAANST